MRQRVMLVIGLVAAAGASLLAWRSGLFSRAVANDAEPQLRQWPFDPAELRNLMDNVVDLQQSRVSEMTPGPERDRAVSFLEYYQRRRAAALS